MTEFTHMKQPVLAAAGGMVERDVLYSTQDLAAILGVSPRTVERWRQDGRGPKVTRLYINAPPKYRGLHILEALEASAER
ncbi:AlpA family transcriptional regulator [Ruegeria sp. HKCCA5491]|uniref:helix-turn-helix transcriptional regulator n=1 Tax=Ruegeria sp. HKCCA5491 TaxID=2682986 RepID=UPI001C2BFAB8|nr:helix-turn-helix domain-containing protein [Ruegeria sp. HKCCA5491]